MCHAENVKAKIPCDSMCACYYANETGSNHQDSTKLHFLYLLVNATLIYYFFDAIS